MTSEGGCDVTQTHSGGTPTRPADTITINRDSEHPERIGLRLVSPITVITDYREDCPDYVDEQRFESEVVYDPHCDQDGTPDDEIPWLSAVDSTTEEGGQRIRTLDFACEEVVEEYSGATQTITVSGTLTRVTPA